MDQVRVDFTRLGDLYGVDFFDCALGPVMRHDHVLGVGLFQNRQQVSFFDHVDHLLIDCQLHFDSRHNRLGEGLLSQGSGGKQRGCKCAGQEQTAWASIEMEHMSVSIDGG